MARTLSELRMGLGLVSVAMVQVICYSTPMVSAILFTRQFTELFLVLFGLIIKFTTRISIASTIGTLIWYQSILSFTDAFIHIKQLINLVYFTSPISIHVSFIHLSSFSLLRSILLLLRLFSCILSSIVFWISLFTLVMNLFLSILVPVNWLSESIHSLMLNNWTC